MYVYKYLYYYSVCVCAQLYMQNAWLYRCVTRRKVDWRRRRERRASVWREPVETLVTLIRRRSAEHRPVR